jgi:hypothetical protein
MSDLSKRCDLCRQTSVSWPETFTVIGPLDLCGNCYWEYRELIQDIADYFNRWGWAPMSEEKRRYFKLHDSRPESRSGRSGCA